MSASCCVRTGLPAEFLCVGSVVIGGGDSFVTRPRMGVFSGTWQGACWPAQLIVALNACMFSTLALLTSLAMGSVVVSSTAH